MPLSSLRGTLYTRASEAFGESATSLDIDGLSDIGEAIADADLFIIDNGGAGTNTKTAVTRIPTYVFSGISGAISINSSGVASLASDASGTNLTLSGDLTVNGTTVTVSASNLAVSDNMIYLNQGVEATVTNAVGDGTNVVYTADNNYTVGMSVTVTGVTPSSFNVSNVLITAATSTTFTIADDNTDTYTSGGTARAMTNAHPDLGFAAGYNDGTYAGLFRDASDATWKFFDSYTPEPDASVYIDTTHASFALADIQAATATVTDLDTTSDVRLKENIETIGDALEKTADLRGVNYNWVKSGEYTMGVVAQEVQEVIPEVVTEKSDGTLTVNYQAMVGLLIEAVKELKEEIDTLKQKV